MGRTLVRYIEADKLTEWREIPPSPYKNGYVSSFVDVVVEMDWITYTLMMHY